MTIFQNPCLKQSCKQTTVYKIIKSLNKLSKIHLLSRSLGTTLRPLSAISGTDCCALAESEKNGRSLRKSGVI